MADLGEVARPRRLLDQVREKLRTLHYSYRTEEAYVGWIKRYILFHGKRHPRDLGVAEVEAYLSSLATRRKVAASTQNQALSALLFLYKQVLEVDLGWVDGVTRAKTPERVPVVLTRTEVASVLQRLSGREWLMASLMYGRPVCRHSQTGDAAHPEALVRHPPAGGRLRHPHGTGAARPSRCRDHPDLHARPPAWRRRGAQSGGCPAGRACDALILPVVCPKCGTDQGTSPSSPTPLPSSGFAAHP